MSGTMSVKKFQVETVARKYKKLRKGQALMNALFDVDPILYAKVTGTKSDCFYDDNRIDEFLKELD